MSIMRSRPLYLLLAVVAAACGTLAGADDTSPPVDADGGVDAASPPPPGDDDGGDPSIEFEAGADVATTPSHRYVFVSSYSPLGYETKSVFASRCQADAQRVPALTGRSFHAFVRGVALKAENDWYLPNDVVKVFDGANPPLWHDVN